MGARLQFWLTGLIAGLFALAIVQAPGQHARAMAARTAFIAAYAMPDGAVPEICPGHALGDGGPADGHGRHLSAPACLACVLVAAPGLAPAAFPAAGRRGAPVAAAPCEVGPVAVHEVAWAPHRARAPPAGSIA
ncbi:hypothetical protein [Amaricoccus sp.]|uniref:hypothetical protein n=1 Tax=Amaricoccus sp. TaxID=1872485 RepID=UPI001B66FAB8|nr:hypothetical protein [Amaricoccus sp.]MBP7242963.1 hypothetical protein [Amaricoccus sp.]